MSISLPADEPVTGLEEHERVLDLAEARRRLGNPSRPTTYTWLDKPDGLPTIRLGRRRYVIERELDAFVDRLRQAGGWDTERGCLLDGGTA